MAKDSTVVVVNVLNIFLILLTAVWILYGIYKGLETLEMMYNYVYVSVTILTLILNLRIINKKEELVK